MKKFDLKGETFIHNIFRYISWQLIDKFLAKTDISPNQITIFRTIVMIISFLFFLKLDIFYYLIGFFLFQFAEMLDSTDGDLARYKKLQSKMGIFLEIFFDNIITPVWGLIGLLFAYISYILDPNYIYFILWGLIGFSNNIEKSLYMNFVEKKAFSDAKHGHVYFGFKGESLITKIRNFIIVSKAWENQWLIFGGLIYSLFGLNVFLYIWIWLLILNQIHWIRIGYRGFIDARNNFI